MTPDTEALRWILIYFVYGLAFFCMGFAIFLEGGRASDLRLRHALRPLAAFGLWHALHEWMEMLDFAGVMPSEGDGAYLWVGAKTALLAFSFLSLAAFGFSSLATSSDTRRMSLLAPLIMAAIWALAVLAVRDSYPRLLDELKVASVLTRYLLGVPAALIAAIGLVVQQRAFRQEGFARFGRDSLVAAIAFAWYGLVGQFFGPASRLWPSTFVNEELFLYWFGFPVQVFRAGMAILAAAFVIRFLRSFDAETEREINELQQARLEAAQRRDKLRGELLQRVVGAQEAERKRIARELHDETGQTLTAVGMGLAGLKQALPEGGAQKRLDEMKALVEGSLQDVQRIIRNLRPSQLDDLGLPAALRSYVAALEKRTDEPQFELSFSGEVLPLQQSIKTALFRIVQEAITNSLKYAGAKNLWVELNYSQEAVELLVRDDGVGFDASNLERKGESSWGVLGMRERASLLKGSFQLRAQEGEGVQIRVRIPIEELEEDEEALHVGE